MSLRVLVADCRDSFVHTIVDYLAALGAQPTVHAAEKLQAETVDPDDVDAILLSPGPGAPGQAVSCHDLLRRFAGVRPILGVCLGHQVIAEYYGATVARAGEPRHGENSSVRHDGTGVFAGLANPLSVTRYHSLAVVESSCPQSLEVTARTAGAGTVMGVRHRRWDVEGVQFHPEAVLSQSGRDMLRNWLQGAAASLQG